MRLSYFSLWDVENSPELASAAAAGEAKFMGFSSADEKRGFTIYL
jgi:hypothetical protein